MMTVDRARPGRGRGLSDRVSARRVLLALMATILCWGVYAAAQGNPADQESQDPPAATVGEPSEELDTFVPSEDVGAEQGVAFPVDI